MLVGDLFLDFQNPLLLSASFKFIPMLSNIELALVPPFHKHAYVFCVIIMHRFQHPNQILNQIEMHFCEYHLRFCEVKIYHNALLSIYGKEAPYDVLLLICCLCLASWPIHIGR